MVKVIIISYFFPPSNYVGGERSGSWAKYLNKFGVYPIIITRNWNDNQCDTLSPLDDNSYKIEKHPHCEIHRLPHKRTFQDKISKKRKYRLLQRFLTFKELLLSNYFRSSIHYYNFYKKAKELLDNDPEIIGFITSGRPFQSFSLGHKLKKKFPNKLFIPDYRDEWSTHQNLQIVGRLLRMMLNMQRGSEKRWTSNCDFFISTSDAWVENISAYINKPGFRVMNGFDLDDIRPLESTTQANQLRIVYAGTLYANQHVGIFIDACIELIDKNVKNIYVDFVGIDMNPDQKQKVLELTANHKDNFRVINRVPRESLEELTAAADLMLLTGFKGVKGWYPVKLFHYYSIQIPILLCPSDDDVLEEFIRACNAGFIVNSKEECKSILEELLEKKNKAEPIWSGPNKELSNDYSREHQTKVLAKIILSNRN